MFLQLAAQRLLRCKLQEKLLRVTWPYVIQSNCPVLGTLTIKKLNKIVEW